MVRIRSLLPYLALAAAIALAYEGVRANDFVGFDDDSYVSENRLVAAGLTPAGIAYAFTTPEGGSWEPLSWLSHMFVCQLFGLSSQAHHLVNLLLHTANAWLLFALLRRMTGRVGASALAAGLFAVHPIHVESVAWLSERKDVLSTLFLLLSTRAYLGYVESSRAGRLALTTLMLALGLMAKPMPVTLPLLLLLLDFWPLGRFGLRGARPEPPRGIVLEKIPLLALSAAIGVVTVWFQHREQFIADIAVMSIPSRLGNALVSYVRYLGKLIWPTDLAAFYPMQEWAPWQVAGAALLLATLTGIAVRSVRHRPYLFVGWSWYLVAMLPVIGVVQVGGQSMADRYAYVPSMGLYIAAAWAAGDLAKSSPATRRAVVAVAISLLVACALQTRRQVRTWRDTLSLFEHAVAVTRNSSFAHYGLGYNLAKQGRHDEAILHLRESIRLARGSLDPRFALAQLFDRRGEGGKAIRELRGIVAIDPGSTQGHYLLGLALGKAGRLRQAASAFEKALALAPDHLDARTNLGIALLKRGEAARAAAELVRVLERRPEAKVHHLLGLALAGSGDLGTAVDHLRQAARLAPGEARYASSLGRVLERRGESEAAIAAYQAALRSDPSEAAARERLEALRASGARGE
jgi:Flp pilus assembly protein TadD